MLTPDTPTDPDDGGHTPVARLGNALTKADPYLAPQLVVAAAIVLDIALPNKVTIGPVWLLPSVEALLLVGLGVSTRRFPHSPTRRTVAMGLIGLVSLVNIVSLGLLVHELLQGRQPQRHRSPPGSRWAGPMDHERAAVRTVVLGA